MDGPVPLPAAARRARPLRPPQGDSMRFPSAAATTLLTLTLATATAWPAAAQTKKVPVGGRPTPGQTLRLNIVQDADMTMKPAEAVAGSPIQEMHLKAKTTTI